MTDRVSSARIAAIFAVAALCLVALVFIAWVVVALQTTLQEFYQSSSANTDAAGTREIDRLSAVSYMLQSLMAPMAFATLTAVFIGLAVLAVRWHDRRVAPREGSLGSDLAG